MKLLYSFLLLFTGYYTYAQEKWTTQTGRVSFEASVPFFEEISAKNNLVKCVLNTEEKTIICVIKIKDFEFKRDLMRTHFNEYYMESDGYPKATFKGKVPELDINTITTEGTIFTINGTIKIHGVSKTMNVTGIFKKTKNQLKITTNFELDTDDFEIKIPSMILPKISKKVRTQLECTLQ